MIKAKIEQVSISTLRENENNPRNINKHKFEKLKNSIKDFPEMLALRPIVVDKDNVILGGNMRYKASKELGLKKVYIIQAENLSDAQAKEFIIKDNVGFGDWDWDILANSWDTSLLTDWGMDVWKNSDDFSFDLEDEEDEKDEKRKISDDNYSSFEIIMYHENKIKLLSVLSKIKKDKQLDKLEDAIMTLIENY